MNLKDILLELVSNLTIRVKLNNETIDVPKEQYYQLRNCRIVECCKSIINGVNHLTLYLDYMDYCLYNNIEKKTIFNFEPIIDYGLDE